MKYLVISDIHGSAPAFQLALDAFQHEQADAIICCGDFLYHGPRNNLPEGYGPKALVPLLNQVKDRIIAVRGNCDAEVDQMLLEFPLMSDYNIIINEGRKYFITHGHLYDERNLPLIAAGNVYISGHTHIPVLRKDEEGIYYLNPGSTTIPKAGSKPGYAIIDQHHAELKTLGDCQTYKSLDFD